MDNKYRVLILDDDCEILEATSRLLRKHEFTVTSFQEPAPALASLRETPDGWDVMICDVSMPSMSGLEVLAQVRDLAADLPVVMLTADNSAKTAVVALQTGAFGYLLKPFMVNEAGVLTVIRAAAYGRLKRHARDLENRIAIGQRFDTLLGASKPMRLLFETIAQVAPLDMGVLILGESGTGKELIARAIHNRSPRSDKSFVALNCGALADGLVDSELFGHEKGAFTGATSAHEGAFERARGGTVFLDEIGDVTSAVQVRLLRVLQEREIMRVGGSSPRPIDVRVIAATMVDLASAVEEGDFRADLFYRLNVINLQVPPLRQKMDDLPLLAAHFLDKHAQKMKRRAPTLSPGALQLLTEHEWPGNVRELENCMLRALALTSGDTVDAQSLRHLKRTGSASSTSGSPAPEEDLAWADEMSFVDCRKRAQERFERAYFDRILKRTKGNLSKAAREVKMDRANLRRALTRCNIDAADYK